MVTRYRRSSYTRVPGQYLANPFRGQGSINNDLNYSVPYWFYAEVSYGASIKELQYDEDNDDLDEMLSGFRLPLVSNVAYPINPIIEQMGT